MRLLAFSRMRIVFFTFLVGAICMTLGSIGAMTFAKSPAPSCAPVAGDNTIVAIAKEICNSQGAPINGWSGSQRVPYVLGGGHYRGSAGPTPSNGAKSPCTGQNCGVDCSGFTRWVYYLAYGSDVLNNRGDSTTSGQILLLTLTKVSSPVPGDLVFFGSSTSSTSHVGIYIGPNQMIDSPNAKGHPPHFVRADQIAVGWGHVLGYYRYTPQFTNISGEFLSNPNNSGAFDITQPVIFQQQFKMINFNPNPSFNLCVPSVNVDENTRPFTDVYQYTASCQTVVAQSSDGVEQAGLNDLYQFQAVFTATITVPTPGTLTSTIVADDGFIFSVGSDSNGNSNQPTAGAGNPSNNPPPSGLSPLRSYQVIAANNQPAAPNGFTVVTDFPAAGTYPVELDYTECCGGALTLVLSNQSFTAQ